MAAVAPEAVIPGADSVLTTYFRVINMGNTSIARHYFSENVVLDWFGRTVVGRDRVLQFLLEELNLVNHDMIEVKPRKDDWQKTRAIARFYQPASPEKEEYDDVDSGFGSTIYESSDSSFSSDNGLTPCSKMAVDLSQMYVTDDNEDYNVPSWSSAFKTPLSTARVPRAARFLNRCSVILKNLKLNEAPANVKFVDATGIITGTPPDDTCGTEPIRPWSKHCHLQIGYCPSNASTVSFSFLLYNDDMPCRRNLSKIFDLCD